LIIGGGMFFQHERGQFFGQRTGHVFALRERHQVLLVPRAEHALERYARTLEPPFPKSLPILATQK
jgi:hypothetical protein